jgi:hypothetical protein
VSSVGESSSSCPASRRPSRRGRRSRSAERTSRPRCLRAGQRVRPGHRPTSALRGAHDGRHGGFGRRRIAWYARVVAARLAAAVPLRRSCDGCTSAHGDRGRPRPSTSRLCSRRTSCRASAGAGDHSCIWRTSCRASAGAGDHSCVRRTHRFAERRTAPPATTRASGARAGHARAERGAARDHSCVRRTSRACAGRARRRPRPLVHLAHGPGMRGPSAAPPATTRASGARSGHARAQNGAARDHWCTWRTVRACAERRTSADGDQRCTPRTRRKRSRGTGTAPHP